MTESAKPFPTKPEGLPLWLAHAHRRLEPGEMLTLNGDPGPLLGELTPSGPTWKLLVEGAGFEQADSRRLRKLHTLADLVGPDLALLVIGLNPSPSSAETGIGFARPGNRFWPAALASGIVSRDREPLHALAEHRVGFTDIVKRTTRKAAELSPNEFRDGMARLECLCRWLRPKACVMIGLMGWRHAVDRKAVAGWQDMTLGESPVYVMPSTSGLNANSSLADLTNHLVTVGATVNSR